MKDVLSVAKPRSPLPLIFDSPHSGTAYPRDFDYACAFTELEYAEDKFVDDLFSCAPEYGASFLQAHFPRSYIDVNRAADDIDPDLLDGDWPFSDMKPSSRSDAGIGLIRRLVKPGVPVYNRMLGAKEIQNRITKYYEPYHTALEKLIDDAHYNYGQVWHINCHSMPASSARPKQPMLIGAPAPGSDFVLGDRDGRTCDPGFTRALRDFIRGMGYTVTVNDPFKGVELVDRYSNPGRGRHSVQIEINKALYMNEETHEKTSDYEALKENIESLIGFCADYVRAGLTAMAAD